MVFDESIPSTSSLLSTTTFKILHSETDWASSNFIYGEIVESSENRLRGSKSMKLREVKVIKSVLSREIGWSWALFMIKCLIRVNAIFGKTHWAEIRDEESRFVKRFSLVCATYIELGGKIGKENAFEAMKKILVPIGCGEQWNHLNSLNLSKDSGMVGLMAFNNLMDKKGAPQFNKREYVRQNNNICHFIITRCIFYDFFTEAGMPELTRLFCEVDREFFPGAFSNLSFHRGDSWENTIAYGKDHCDFIFEKKS